MVKSAAAACFVFFLCTQTRSLLGVFEEDTAAVSNYCTQLYQAMQRIYDAQVQLDTQTRRLDTQENPPQLIGQCIRSRSLPSSVLSL